ncbi:MAG: DUF1772 domain-containing protein [Bacteroidetes bacterium]|nr:DUF1772 domain-containing protein [Fibrella sp.]
MPTLPNVMLAGAALTTALVAGLFYGYSCSVNPGLHRLSDTMYLAAMQAINRAILNPVFFVSFLGTLILLPLSAWVHYSQPPSPRFWLLLWAAITYLIGVLGVTIFGNVPLNEALDSLTLQTASVEAVAAQRVAFETLWNRFHTIRTLASVLALLFVLVACLSPETDR